MSIVHLDRAVFHLDRAVLFISSLHWMRFLLKNSIAQRRATFVYWWIWGRKEIWPKIIIVP